MDDDPEVTITAYSLLDPAGTGGPAPDRSWVTRVPTSWPAPGSPGAGVADAAFTAARESFLAAPPAPEFLHPLRVHRDGDTAVLVFTWRADRRRFAIRVDLPTVLEEIDEGWGQEPVWAVPDPQTGLVTSGPVDWAGGLDGWLEEELLTGAVRGATHRDGDLLVVDLASRDPEEEDRAYYVSGGTWGPEVAPAFGIDQESVPPAGIVAEVGFPTAALAAAGRAATLVSWALARVNSRSGGPLVGQAVCVATGPAKPGSATLVSLDVAPAHTGRGLEKRLLDHVLGDAADAGITTLDGITAALPAGSGWSTDPTRPSRVHLDL